MKQENKLEVSAENRVSGHRIDLKRPLTINYEKVDILRTFPKVKFRTSKTTDSGELILYLETYLSVGDRIVRATQRYNIADEEFELSDLVECTEQFNKVITELRDEYLWSNADKEI